MTATQDTTQPPRCLQPQRFRKVWCGYQGLAHLAGDDLQRASKRVDEQLCLAGDAARVLPAERSGQGCERMGGLRRARRERTGGLQPGSGSTGGRLRLCWGAWLSY